MAFSEFEYRRIESVVATFVEEHRPPPDVRPQLDLAFPIAGQSVEIFEIRPRWRGKHGETVENAVAKATFVKTSGRWKVYWKRADLKWHAYPPNPIVRTLERFLKLVAQDEHGCFFG
jgi:hypothetical protein